MADDIKQLYDTPVPAPGGGTQAPYFANIKQLQAALIAAGPRPRKNEPITAARKATYPQRVAEQLALLAQYVETDKQTGPLTFKRP